MVVFFLKADVLTFQFPRYSIHIKFLQGSPSFLLLLLYLTLISSSCLCLASSSFMICIGLSGTIEVRSPLWRFWQYWAIKECSSLKIEIVIVIFLLKNGMGSTHVTIFCPRGFFGSGCCCGVILKELLSSDPDRVSSSASRSESLY